MRKLDLSNQRFGECQVVDFAGASIHGKSQWNCLCDCGKQFIALGSELKSGHTKSCGCYSRSGTFNITHGYRMKGRQTKQHPLYSLWINIRERCHNPNHPRFTDYGGRGITVYHEWDSSFEIFLDYILNELGERPPLIEGYDRYWSIDRIDNAKGYEPDNIRWSDPTTQKLNQRPRRWWKRPKEVAV